MVQYCNVRLLDWGASPHRRYYSNMSIRRRKSISRVDGWMPTGFHFCMLSTPISTEQGSSGPNSVWRFEMCHLAEGSGIVGGPSSFYVAHDDMIIKKMGIDVYTTPIYIAYKRKCFLATWLLDLLKSPVKLHGIAWREKNRTHFGPCSFEPATPAGDSK